MLKIVRKVFLKVRKPKVTGVQPTYLLINLYSQ